MSSNFSERMKKYEAASDIKLTERIPLIVRLDGNSFSKFTKQMNFKKPFDDTFYNAMCEATKNVLQYCSGGMIGYTQSDEITILLRNDMTQETQAFLGNRLEKLCSLLASTASVAFNKALIREQYVSDEAEDKFDGTPIEINPEEIPTATFDCRVFLVPEKEVNNAFLWRQQDAFKNAVQGVAFYGLKEKYGRKTAQKMLYKKDNSEQQELIFQELGMNINNYPTKYKRGVCIKRIEVQTPIEQLMSSDKIEKLGKQGEIVTRKVWTVDEEIPRFDRDPDYINNLLV